MLTREFTLDPNLTSADMNLVVKNFRLTEIEEIMSAATIISGKTSFIRNFIISFRLKIIIIKNDDIGLTPASTARQDTTESTS